MAEEEIGKVSHWFSKISVVGISLTGKLRVGDRIRILGHTTDFEQEIRSMQIEHDNVEEAGPGDEIGIKVRERARVGDRVYKVSNPKSQAPNPKPA